MAIGLLHDLTHAPFGHTVEDEIQLVACKHDDPQRQADAFYRLICQYLGWLARDAGVPDEDGSLAATDRGFSIPASLVDYLEQPEMPPPANWESIATFATELLNKAKGAPHTVSASWRLTADEVLELLVELNFAMTALLHLELLHENSPEPKHFPRQEGHDFQRLLRSIIKACGKTLSSTRQFQPARDAFMLDIVGNTVCADLLDYAKRDSHYSNLKLDYDPDRIAENFTIVNWNPSEYNGGDGKDRRKVTGQTDPFSGFALRTAISLFSHKLRTDVPGELMNLLNVRFHLYERAIFHSTKCAAGAMLGTALQLLGWRPFDGVQQDSGDLLPERFRHVGDAVFLDTVAEAARLALNAIDDAEDCVGLSKAAQTLESHHRCPQVELAIDLLGRRSFCPMGERAPNGGKQDVHRIGFVRQELAAGLKLLGRLKARRYFKTIFRNLPNTWDEVLDCGPDEIANHFGKNATKRYRTEREIERRANLLPGSVVIYCPPTRTAQKIANALLFLPTGTGKIRKLRDIKDIIKDKVFDEHQGAITAVEKMYKSMWRMEVYVAPQYRSRYKDIADLAGKVIVEQLDVNNQHPEHKGWRNDPYLEQELEAKSRGQDTPSSVRLDHPIEGHVRVSLKAIDLGRQLEPVLAEYHVADVQIIREALAAFKLLANGDAPSMPNAETATEAKGSENDFTLKPPDHPIAEKDLKVGLVRFVSILRPQFGGRLRQEDNKLAEKWYRENTRGLVNAEKLETFLGNIDRGVSSIVAGPRRRLDMRAFLDALKENLLGR